MSTNRRTNNLQSLGPINQTYVAGSFAPNGNSAVSATLVKGWVSSVTMSTTGTYFVTLPSTMPELLSGVVHNQAFTKGSNTTSGITVQMGEYSPTAGTFFVYSMNTGTTTLVNIAANDSNRIHFQLCFRNSGVTR